LLELIEVPRLDDGDVFAVGPAVELSARERALQVAFTAETSAHNFYARLVEQTEQGPLRRLYTELSMMEEGHVGFLRKILEESTTGSDKGVN
jgi:rubrerythrin